MVFAAGVLVGSVFGFGLSDVLVRRPQGAVGPADRHRLTVGIAVLALLVSAAALANSGRHEHSGVTASVASVSSSTTVASTSSTTTTTGTRQTVSVPKVVDFARDDAVSLLQRAGLKASIETISLTNVPAGFVISQSPLPASTVMLGSTVALVVSSAA